MLRSWTFNFRRLYSAATDVKRAASEIPFPAPTTNTATNNRNTANNSNHKYNCNSIRTGALGIKKGMMSYWDTWGKMHPVTILHLDHVQALDTFKCGSSLIQNLAISHKSPHQTHPAQLKYFKECGTAPKLKVHGFKISEGAQVDKGKFIYAAHFVAGQYVDVIGKSIGKGFQGAMKRWGFHGQPASHGTSLSHRAIGATGGRSDPGRVFKGKKMAGRMGGDRVTVRKLKIMRIDTALNCLWLKGAVPGHDNSIVRILDSKCPENRELFKQTCPPFPTISDKIKLPREIDAPAIETKDPLKLGD